MRARSEEAWKRMDRVFRSERKRKRKRERERERAKKSEAVEGKKEDSRRFNTR